jgi:hypothetical protein
LIAVPVDQGYATFITGRFDAQDMHAASVATRSRAESAVRIATPQANRHN